MDAHETPIYHAVIACGIIILLINGVFVFSSIWMQRRFKAKKRLKAEAEIVRMEKERASIAADLHDAAGPLIYSVNRKFEDAIGADEKSKLLLAEGQQLLVVLSEQLNAISKAMGPLSLERKGLLYSLEELVFEKGHEHNLKILLRCKVMPKLDIKAETHIYRIIQEIVHNTIKHAGATRLIIEFEKKGEQLIIRTSDNGKGCDLEKISALQPGLGMGNIETRASFLNGTAIMRSVRGCQWEIRLEV